MSNTPVTVLQQSLLGLQLSQTDPNNAYLYNDAIAKYNEAVQASQLLPDGQRAPRFVFRTREDDDVVGVTSHLAHSLSISPSSHPLSFRTGPESVAHQPYAPAEAARNVYVPNNSGTSLPQQPFSLPPIPSPLNSTQQLSYESRLLSPAAVSCVNDEDRTSVWSFLSSGRNIMQFKHVVVDPQMLTSLMRAVQFTTLEYLNFYFCSLGEQALMVLRDIPLSHQIIELRFYGCEILPPPSSPNPSSRCSSSYMSFSPDANGYLHALATNKNDRVVFENCTIAVL
eukprot:TRINITY_DN14625_c0_g1_i1.p1 TRINITY_DN14625_c0_g1~~TRINITY_DN14625_c0_g1_i1.p1  ORF type:complete len:283 (+),score=30.81 TRINITY_DN14625_c0_g1_i1:158-1006(+)